MRALSAICILGFASVVRVAASCEATPGFVPVEDAGTPTDAPPSDGMSDAGVTTPDGRLDARDLDAGVDADADVDAEPPRGPGACASASSCYFSCANNEVCFTQVACGTTADGVACGPSGSASAALGDNRCHRKCKTADDCAEGESCRIFELFGCSDVRAQRGICCGDAGCD